MDKSPVTCRTLEEFYHIDSSTLEKQYKDALSGYRTWTELDHTDQWLVFPDNIGCNLAIDETSLSNGDLYTISQTEIAMVVSKASWPLQLALRQKRL